MHCFYTSTASGQDIPANHLLNSGLYFIFAINIKDRESISDPGYIVTSFIHPAEPPLPETDIRPEEKDTKHDMTFQCLRGQVHSGFNI